MLKLWILCINFNVPIDTINFFDNSFTQIELIELIRQISTETLIEILLSAVIFLNYSLQAFDYA